MKTNTGEPTATDISLTYDDDTDQWVAREETRDVTVRASSREAALQALDEAVATATETDRDVEIDPNDPFFAAPTFSSGRSDISRDVDKHLAEGTYRDKLGSDEGS